MIFVEAGTRSIRSFDAQLIFAQKLKNRGFNACVDADYLPDDAGRGRLYEAARLLVDPGDHRPDSVFVLGAEEVEDQLLASLRQKALDPDIPVIATGRFQTHQSYIGSKARLAFALGREAKMIDLTDTQPRPMLNSAVSPLVAELRPVKRPIGEVTEVTVILGSMELDNPEILSCLFRMSNQSDYNLKLVVSGAQNEFFKETQFSDLSRTLYTDLSPLALAGTTDILAMFGNGIAGDRMAEFAVELIAAGGLVIDCTEDQVLMSSGAPTLQGPTSLFALGGYLTDKVLPNTSFIAEQAQKSQWLRSMDISKLESAAGLVAKPQQPSRTTQRTLFLPTNGVGLGHAQRCTVIANALPSDISPVFAVFPSCVPIARREGFDCVPLVARSDALDSSNANDILNYRRLSGVLQKGDKLVFDGGYVFDSVHRVIQENRLSAVWIRRGLWPQGRSRHTMLRRKDIFDRVIVPSEAFDELNDAYSYGDQVHYVGPVFRQIVQTKKDSDLLRARLAERFGRDFKQMVVSMLGGGVASDRSAQLQAISGMLENREDCLHLVVTWPGSTVQASAFGWKNTKLVYTQEAIRLCMAADLVISAAGYNSVHEFLYHKIPSILIPQSAPYLDDQERRARALSDRALCATITESEFMKLERAVLEFLDHGIAETFRSALMNIELPEPGASTAAELLATT
ncbi:glycosyltransferase [Ruegeria arenilitoris]|uniref:glycosyltransferase n=1 Tax=Ruegeria arenilitoris TaxID=1173585 RepID=UPI00147FDD86|nr:glycosyltransferase [Ruegeria arenilitoris]